MNTSEDIIPIKIAIGVNSTSVSRKIDPGKVVGVVTYYNKTTNNPGMVRAAIKNSAGTEISKMQPLENYRSRDCEYLKGAKPLNVQGGDSITIDIVATANFTAETQIDFVFIYETQEQFC